MSLFKNVKVSKPKRNAFNLSHEKKLSMNMGELIPIFCEEVVPGDSFRIKSEIMMRMAPLVAPMMHRVNVYTHFFFVPNRLVWDDWEDFITGGDDGLQEPVMPYISVATASLTKASIFPGTLPDYMGVQGYYVDGSTGAEPSVGYYNSLAFRAYQLIYNEYYRDQNLQDEITFSTGSGLESQSDTDKLTTVRTRCWEKDYFTSALDDTQKGSEVSLPLGDVASLSYDHTLGDQYLRDSATGNAITNGAAGHNIEIGDDGAGYGTIEDASTSGDMDVDVSGTHEVDLSTATSASINDLRTATRLQRWLERNMRAGSRYIEQILSHFGVMSSDARLQRPEFLGGGKSPVVISEVLQTSQTDTTPQANMSGHGISVGNTHGFKKYFEEHGYIIGIMSVMPRTAYNQGVRRHFLKTDRYDYFWPEFAHLGEQPVYKKELWYDNNYNTGLTTVLGYQSRYAEYKHIPDSVHGDFRATLNHWHMAREFGADVALNDSFVESDPTHRIFADTDTDNDKLYVQIYHNCQALRPMPYFGTPML